MNVSQAAADDAAGYSAAVAPAAADARSGGPSYGGATGVPAEGRGAAQPSLEDAEGQVDLPPLGAPQRAPQPAAASAPVAAPAAPPSAPAAPAPPPPPQPEPPRERAAAPPPPPPLFGKPDPHGKARRLARALVSDIAVYNPERRDRGLADGTLRQEFREEIRKSWDEYVGQVGDSIARGTPYFREALNEILAGGRAVF